MEKVNITVWKRTEFVQVSTNPTKWEARKIVKVGVVDEYKSLIWKESCGDPGEFELYVPMSAAAFDLFRINRIVTIDETFNTLGDEDSGDHAKIMAQPDAMIIEKIEITTNQEDGSYMIVSGRNWRTIFSRRVIGDEIGMWTTSLKQDVLEIGGKTAWNGFTFGIPIAMDNTLWSNNSDYTANDLTTGESWINMEAYDLMTELTRAKDSYWKLLFNPSNYYLAWLYIYRGVDRSGQKDAPKIEISEDFDTIISSEYIVDYTDTKNACLAVSEGEWYRRRYAWYDYKNAYIYDEEGNWDEFRERQMAVISDVPNTHENGDMRPLYPDMEADLRAKGKAEIDKRYPTETFTAEIQLNQFIYRKDYFIGDRVKVKTSYGLELIATIDSVTRTWDDSGYHTDIQIRGGVA